MASGLNADDSRAAPSWGGEVLAQIDWTAPWFAPWAALGQPATTHALQAQSVTAALNHLGDPLHAPLAPARPAVGFVPQQALPAGQAYEDFIFSHQQVPTRDGLHDFFNGLCWHRFPLAKRRLNQLQAAEIQRQGIGHTRGALRDALTLFDENALLWQGPDVLWQALQARDWRRLLVAGREAWQEVHLVLFGHALLEKLVTPYKSITGHVYRVDLAVDARDDQALDAWLAQDLQPDKLATKPYEPLPVLGVPGWWPENAQPSFYDDAQVFRPKRTSPQRA